VHSPMWKNVACCSGPPIVANEFVMLDWHESVQPEIGFDFKVRFLGSPLTYPEHPSRVERIERPITPGCS